MALVLSRVARFRVLNALTLVAVVALNGAAATGAMSGDSIGVLANRSPSLFLPANFTFGIWSLIYAGLFACLAFQLLPSAGGRRTVERLGWWWAVAGALNVAWITLFSFSLFGPALVVMLALLAALVWTGERLRRWSVTWPERVLAVWPHDLYLAWIAVAVIANSFQSAHVIGFGGAGITETGWAVAMMVAAALLGALMAYDRKNWIFPLVVAWALYGIGVRHAADPVIGTASGWVATAGVALGAVAWVMGTWGSAPEEEVPDFDL
jgi:hypothetical protein